MDKLGSIQAPLWRDNPDTAQHHNHKSTCRAGKMNPSVKRSTSALLASSLLLTIGRGATLPFMTIYLTRQYGMSVEAIGYALTIALSVGVFFSLGFGILADKFDKKRYMIAAILAFIVGFAAIPLVNSVVLVVFSFH